MSQPDGALRAARMGRGWSQSRAVSELVALAAKRGITVAAPASLKTQLSRWENQHAVPDDHYRALLRELYVSTDAELGLSDATTADATARDDADGLRARLRASAALDDSTIELLRAQLDTTRRLDDRLGAPAAAGPARAQLSHLEEALHHAVRPSLRRQLASLVADASMLAGRLALDQAQPSAAWHDYETAKAAAQELGSTVLLGVAMAEQASVLLDVGERHVALSTVEQAITVAFDDAPAPIRAWLEASHGEALAANGAADDARTAYLRAEQRLTERPARMDVRIPPVPILVFDLTALHRHRGHSHQLLHEDRAAIADLESTLEVGGRPVRDLANVHLDLARAHYAVGHASTAAQHARLAREIATRIGSVRIAARLDKALTEAGDEPTTAAEVENPSPAVRGS